MAFSHPNRMLILQILLAAVLLLYLPLREEGAPVFLFWPLYFLLITVSLLIVLGSDWKHCITSLVVLEIALSSIYIVCTPYEFQLGRDVYFESEYATTITQAGTWNPAAGIGYAQNYYGYNPVIHFVLAFASLATGLSAYTLSKYFFFIIFRVLLLISALLIFSLFISRDRERMLYVAAFIFIGSFGMSFIDISRRVVAAIFMLLAFYALARSASFGNRRKWEVLFILFSALTVISNHSMGYMLLALLVLVWLFGIFLNSRTFALFSKEGSKLLKGYPRVGVKILTVATIIILWEVLVAPLLLANDLRYVGTIASLLSMGLGLISLIYSTGSATAAFTYRAYEIAVLYMYQIGFILIGCIGMGLYLRRLARGSAETRIAGHRGLLAALGLVSLGAYVISFLLIKTELDSASYTFLWFFCIAISLFIAYFIDKLYSWRARSGWFLAFLIVLSLLLYTGYAMSGIYTPRLTNRAPNEAIVIGTDMRAKTPELYYSAAWLNSTADKGAKLLGDINVFEIYGGLFEFDVSTDAYNLRRLYEGSAEDFSGVMADSGVYFGSYAHTMQYHAADYIIIDRRFYEIPSYLFSRPVDIARSYKLHSAQGADRLYDNSEIIIFRNDMPKG